ncbi:alpha/beta fold hydrolase [Permianibacter aggregans]|uniref:alpha/beta fold hydrolase n=1 Tax=Permianibacter aggregans TaxID=1510150 RepID=UPI00105FDD16|nr:alpha/beta hydrolase [Permianibacter aggregans]QGX40969.1 alpha/beta hydrolase [Permianibacter aggregans]
MSESAPVIVLRGLSREAAHAEAFLQALRNALPNHTVHCPDLPGTGQRFQERSPNRVEAIVSELRRTAPEGNKHLVGISLGGMIACEWARQTATETRSLTMVNASLRRYSFFWQRLRWQQAARIISALWHWRNVEKRERRIMALVSNLPFDAERLRQWVAIQRARPVSWQTISRQMQAAAHYAGPINAPCPNTQVLISRQDKLVSPACSEQIAAAWRVPAHYHPEGGHDLFLDAPSWAARQVADWILHHN